jgi:hypothetical protein
LIYRNHVHRTSHLRTARLYRDYRPEVLCTGHGLFTNVAPEGYELFFSNAERLSALFNDLLPEQSGIRGLEPSWIQIYPYQMAADPGATLVGEVRIRNPLESTVDIHYRWVVPEGSVQLSMGAAVKKPFNISIPTTYCFLHPKQAVALEVVLGDQLLGQVVEAVVENRPYGAASVRPLLSIQPGHITTSG